MGWTHALSLCQSLHRGFLEADCGFDPARLITDAAQGPSLDPWAYTVYVDNCLAFETDESEVRAAVQRGIYGLNAMGLPTDGVCAAALEAEVLGWRGIDV